MAELIKMPKMSDTMQHGIISCWLKKVGDKIVPGDILAEVETDKATMELESYEEGILLHIGAEEKSVVAINEIIAIIGEEGEDITHLYSTSKPSKADVVPAPMSVQPILASPDPITLHAKSPLKNSDIPLHITHTATEKSQHTTVCSGRFYASPLAKKLAKEKGYDLKQIVGSGPHGRIVKEDVLRATFVQSSSTSSLENGQPLYIDLPISTMRQTVAKVLTKSKSTIPHFYLTISIRMDELIELRTKLNLYAPTKISINDWITKAVALSLSSHPEINSAWLEDKIRSYNQAHIGVAMAIEGGLVVPTIQFADKKSLLAISKEIKILHEKAKKKKLTPQDCSDSTFTISNLGMLGVESFTAIINPPAACILAVGAVQKIPIVQDQQIVPAHMMQVTLSCDHRVVDGAVGGEFLSTLKGFLEEPLRLLM